MLASGNRLDATPISGFSDVTEFAPRGLFVKED
jgi:hypothetical protein